MELKKTLEVNRLISIYGKLLNEKQKFVVESYFYYDNSLSEIADELDITRQAVSDLINRVVKTLYSYDKKLELVSKFDNIQNKIKAISLKCDDAFASELEKITEILEG